MFEDVPGAALLDGARQRRQEPARCERSQLLARGEGQKVREGLTSAKRKTPKSPVPWLALFFSFSFDL